MRLTRFNVGVGLCWGGGHVTPQAGGGLGLSEGEEGRCGSSVFLRQAEGGLDGLSLENLSPVPWSLKWTPSSGSEML